MRCGNLPVGGYDKETWTRSSNLLTRRRNNIGQRRDGHVLRQETLLGVLFGSCKRGHRDVLMEYHGYVSPGRVGDVPLKRRWVFFWNLLEIWWIITDGMSLLRPVKITLRRSTIQYDVVERYHWVVLATWDVGGCFICDGPHRRLEVQREVATTFCCCVGHYQ